MKLPVEITAQRWKCQQFYRQQHNILSNCFMQFTVLADGGPIRSETCRSLWFCNIIVTVLQLCAVFGLNCSNWIVMHGVENVERHEMYCWYTNCYVFAFFSNNILNCRWNSSALTVCFVYTHIFRNFFPPLHTYRRSAPTHAAVHALSTTTVRS